MACPSRTIAWSLSLLVLLAARHARPAQADEEFAFHHEFVMGTSLELLVRADGWEAARGAEEKVLGEIDRLARVFSGYDPTSELNRWQTSEAAPGPRPVSPDLFELLTASDRWNQFSGGAFDPRVEVLTRLWTTAAARDRLPSNRERVEALALLARPAWRLDRDARTAERLSDCPISLNAIAKGYIVERSVSVGARCAGGSSRASAQRRWRPSRLWRPRTNRGDRRPVRRLGIERAAHVRQAPRQGTGHQRPFPARISDRRALVLAYLRSSERLAGRAYRVRLGHRRSIGRCQRAGQGLQRARPRGKPAAGPGGSRCRVPDRGRRRQGHTQPRLGRIRAGSPGRARDRPGRESRRARPDQVRGAITTSWSSISRSTTPTPAASATGGRSWRSGSRTRKATRSAT